MTARKKAKFRRGQVVMVCSSTGDRYPVKLDHITTIGTRDGVVTCMDSINNVEYESEMRPLTKREKGEDR